MKSEEIIMKTFYGPDGNYADIPLSKILERMTDDWIDNEITGENTSELRDACIKLLSPAPAERWVSVEERLPDGEMDVLVVDNGFVDIARWGLWNAHPRNIIWGFMSGVRQLRYGNITHWQPLPKPPAEGKGEEG